MQDCQTFLLNGAEIDLEKQFPVQGGKRAPLLCFLVETEWKKGEKWRKNRLCHRGGCRDAMNTQGLCTGCIHAPLYPCFLLPWMVPGNRNRGNGKFPGFLWAGHTWLIHICFHSSCLDCRQGIRINPTAAPSKSQP